MRQVLKTVFQISPADGSSALRLEGDAVTAAVIEGIHLFFDDVRTFPDAAREKPGIFEDRRLDAFVAVKLSDISRLLLDITPVGLFFRQDISGAARCIVHGVYLSTI